LDERLDAAQRDLARRDLDATDHRHSHIAEVPDERCRGPDKARKKLCAKARVVYVIVEFSELLDRPGPVAEGLDHREAAVGLLDVGVESAGMAHCATNRRCERRAMARVIHSDSGHRDDGEQRQQRRDGSIITSTATTVSIEVNSWLIVIDNDV